MNKPWTHPAKDQTLDLEKFKAQDPDDPRALGEGPCGEMHLEPVTVTDSNPNMKFSGNNYARWCDCKTCGLRLATYPKHGHTGRYSRRTNPAIVREALE
eukprot:1625853-Alexandrium_andersonii.AAC.1